MIRENFTTKINQHKERLKEFAKKGAIVGNIRLFVALLCLVFATFLIINWFSVLFLSLFLAALGGFVFLSVIHSGISAEISYSKGIIQINEQHLKRVGGEWKDFKDSGKEFTNYDHPYSHDLDVFGKKSLFQLINVTKTPYGRKKLSEDLACPQHTNSQILERQEAIAELSKNDKLSDDFEYYGNQTNFNKDLEKVVDYVSKKKEFFKENWLSVVLRILPFIIVGLCVVFLAIGTTPLRIAAAALIVIQLLLWAGMSPKTLEYLANSEKIHYRLSDYSELYSLIENQTFTSKRLKELQSQLVIAGNSASVATKQLSKVMQKIQVRTSGIMYIILNILFLWDISCAISLSIWTRKYAANIKMWFNLLGEFESLLSFSILGQTIDGASMPKISASKHTYNAKNIGHPLLDNNTRVCNSFSVRKNITIISGSNMSGKTTFLRTLGINLLLAKNGSFVCAEDMTFSNMEIATSMRIADDLTEGISTFYSELKKIKSIIEMAKNNSDTFFLIDEIFRGTNSADRTSGAKAVIKSLKGLDAYGLLTTHDLKLCEDTEGVDIDNFNFCENYNNGKLTFDYKIRQGIAQTTNGEYLMKIIGIMT